MKRRIGKANVVQYHENYRVEGRELIRRTVIQCRTHSGGSEIGVIRGEGNDDKGK